MKALILILVLAIAIAKQGDCVTAYCGPQVKACRQSGEDQCAKHVAKCGAAFRKKVNQTQKQGSYKGVEAAQDDFNYCMSTDAATKSLNMCARQNCQKIFLQEGQYIDEILAYQ